MKKTTINIIPAFAPAIALYTDTYPANCITRSEMLCNVQDGWQTQYNVMAGLDIDGSLTEIVKDELRAAKAVMNALFYVDIKLTVRTDNSRHVQVIDLAHQHSDKAIPRYMDARDLADAFTELGYALAPWADPNPALDAVTDYLDGDARTTYHCDLQMACYVMAHIFYDKLGIPADERDKIDRYIASHYMGDIA